MQPQGQLKLLGAVVIQVHLITATEMVMLNYCRFSSTRLHGSGVLQRYSHTSEMNTSLSLQKEPNTGGLASAVSVLWKATTCLLVPRENKAN